MQFPGSLTHQIKNTKNVIQHSQNKNCSDRKEPRCELKWSNNQRHKF